jgi:hypothetical protein
MRLKQYCRSADGWASRHLFSRAVRIGAKRFSLLYNTVISILKLYGAVGYEALHTGLQLCNFSVFELSSLAL